jgi:signal peptide peptidase SppA
LPHEILAELAAERWLLEHSRREAFFARLGRAYERLAARTGQAGPGEAGASPRGYEIQNGVAVIPVRGVMLKRVPEWALGYESWLGILGMDQLSALIDAALQDSRAKAILFTVESPGGMLAGLQELADQVFAARSVKYMAASVEDLVASAAYWFAAQTHHITANRMATAGSIGVYETLVDTSAAYAAQGYKVHRIRSGPLKGVGADGAPITPDELQVEQELITEACQAFVEAVSRGRGLAVDKVTEMATGRSWFSPAALSLGLIDGIASKAKALELAAAAANPQATPTLPTPTSPQPAAQRAAKGHEMSEEMKRELEQLRAEKAEAERAKTLAQAEAKVQAEAMKALTATRKQELIEQGVKETRITPAQRATVDTVAEACGSDTKKLEEFIATLPIQGRSARASVAEPVPPGSDATAGAQPGDAAMARKLGIDPELMAKYGDVKSVAMDGQLIR